MSCVILPNALYHNTVCPVSGAGGAGCNLSVYVDSVGEEHIVPFVLPYSYSSYWDDATSQFIYIPYYNNFPSIAPMQMREDRFNASFTQVDLDDGVERFCEPDLIIDSSYSANDVLFNLKSSINAFTSVRLRYNAGNLSVLWVAQDGAGSIVKGGTPSIAVGAGVQIKPLVTIHSDYLRLTVGGTTVEDSTIVVGGDNTVDGVVVSAQTSSANLPCEYFSFESSMTGFVDFVTRLPYLADLNANKFTSDNDTVFTGSDFSPFGYYWPRLTTGFPSDYRGDEVRPDNGVLADGAIALGFNDVADWDANAKLSNDLTHIKNGTKSIKFTETTPGVITSSINKTVNLDLSSNEYFNFQFYVEDITALNFIALYMANNAGVTEYNLFAIDDVEIREGWNNLPILFSEFTASGGGDFANPIVRVRINISSQSGKTAEVYFNELSVDQKNTTAIMMGTDDGYESDYTEFFSYCQPKGIRGTCYVIKDFIGTAGFMTEAQIQEMYDAGWCIGNHTDSHVNLTTLTKEQQRTALNTCRDYLISKGWTRGAKHVAYPFGAYNNDTLEVMFEEGYFTGRTVEENWGVQSYPVADMYQLLKSGATINTTDSVAYLQKFDKLKITGAEFESLTHKIVETATETIDTSRATFRAIIDGLDPAYTVTKDQWYDNYKHTIDKTFVDNVPPAVDELVPDVGEIGDPVLGYRDPKTGEFTPDAGEPDSFIKEDRWSTATTCLVVDGGGYPSIGGDFTTEFTREFL